MNFSRSDLQLLWFMGGLTAATLLAWWLGRGQPAPAPPLADTGRLAPAVVHMPVPATTRPISGNWVGWLTAGTTVNRFRFSLREERGRLSGTVHFPVGDGVVQSGTLQQDRVTLVTLNPLAAGGQPLRTQFAGTYAGDVIHLVMETGAGSIDLTLQREL